VSKELLSQISSALIDGDADLTVELSQKALDSGVEPMSIVREGLMAGMNVVGENFASGEFFLPDLIIAADCMKKAMDLLEPELVKRQQALETPGIVVIGTVKGDIHEIGKSLVATMLSANGFKVIDLGVDVSTERIIQAVKDNGATLVGLSALLTTTMTMQREIIKSLKEAGLREQLKVMVGGAPVTRSWAEEIGADGYAEDAMGAVLLAKRLAGKD
jgi:corrinoid protein of di/trimethylamine methyltransferase